MRRESIRKRFVKRLRLIAKKNKVPFAEVNRIWRSQFAFAKEKLESYDREFLANATEEELEEIVINFIYLGKIHSAGSLQKFGNKKNGIGRDECSKE